MNDCQICNLPKESVFAESAFSKATCSTVAIKPGHLIIALKEHKADLTDLTQEEIKDLTGLLHISAEALTKVFPHEKLYVIAVGDLMPHFHFHLVPRNVGEPPLGPSIFGPEGWNKAVGREVKAEEAEELRSKLSQNI